jgi:hypothetical protein
LVSAGEGKNAKFIIVKHMLVNLLVIFIFGMDPLLSQETGGIKHEACVI